MGTQYDGKDNYGKPKSEYLAKIAAMDDESLEKEAGEMIWFSAFASNNIGSDYHWMADSIYDECLKRDRIDIYNRAFDKVRASCG